MNSIKINFVEPLKGGVGMTATGMVRRIDNLGRIVIPKEIRKSLRVREGDALEIYIGSEKEIIFKKYHAIEQIMSKECADILCKEIFMPVLISNRDHIVSAFGVPKQAFIGLKTSHTLEKLIEARKYFSAHESAAGEAFFPLENTEKEAEMVFPILAGGDIEGSLIVLKSPKSKLSYDVVFKLAEFSAKFLSSSIES